MSVLSQQMKLVTDLKSKSRHQNIEKKKHTDMKFELVTWILISD